MAQAAQPGALVVSLDLELHWGVRDHRPVDGDYARNLHGARQAIPRMLAAFEQSGIAATWAAVGFLFAADRDQLELFSPALRPAYRNPRLNPYREPLGHNEQNDPLHYGASLLKAIAAVPRQEIASHTFSHFFCLEDGVTAEAFRADLEAAQRIAQATIGIPLRSLVFPRNQCRPEWLAVAADAGFVCYRGNRSGAAYAARNTSGQASLLDRGLRLADAYVPIAADTTIAWHELAAEPASLHDVRASRFVFPYRPALGALDPALRLERMRAEMRHAARTGRVYHLWWHPHNFGRHLDQSMRLLDALLAEFRALHREFGFRSLTMLEAAQESRRTGSIFPWEGQRA